MTNDRVLTPEERKEVCDKVRVLPHKRVLDAYLLAQDIKSVKARDEDWIEFLNKCFKRSKSLTITGKGGKGFTQITMPSGDFNALKRGTEGG